MTERSTRDWALLYASLGLRVFPVKPGQKSPSYKGWQRDATVDPSLIARYWRRDPAPNIGLICGEAFVAFDIEADHLPPLSAWMRAHGHRMPETPVARTGRGGIHILVEPFVLGGRALRLEGVRIGELKGRGGFIVVAPSRTVGVYSWLRRPDDHGVLAAPGWLIGLSGGERVCRGEGAPAAGMLGVGRGEVRLAALARAVRDAQVGSRNDLLYWAVRRALEDGVPGTVAASVLSRMARAAGLDGREVDSTVRSALEATT